MNESTVSSAFQKKFRATNPEAVLIKLADKSMIGLCDAFAAMNTRTVFMEYKLVNTVDWTPEQVASCSPTQYALMQRLAAASNGLYLFWVLDHKALRKRVSHIIAWHPNTKAWRQLSDNDDAVRFVSYVLNGGAW